MHALGLLDDRSAVRVAVRKDARERLAALVARPGTANSPVIASMMPAIEAALAAGHPWSAISKPLGIAVKDLRRAVKAERARRQSGTAK